MCSRKRKKLEKQMALEAEQQAAFNREAEELAAAERAKGPRASLRYMNNRGPVPIAPPSDFIQLTPIVQPIPLVPYSTQMQPLLTFDDYENEELEY